jgi:hypothetical protein
MPGAIGGQVSGLIHLVRRGMRDADAAPVPPGALWWLVARST